MRIRRSPLITRIARCLTAAISLAFILSQAVPAQTRRAPAERDLKTQQRNREVRETMLRKSGLGAEIEKRDQRRIDAAVEQIKKDFRQIQVVRNEIVRNLLAGKPPSYRLISSEAGEINKRAARLKEYLVPTVPGGEQPQKGQIEFDEEQIKDALVRLCNLISSFVENPALLTPGAPDDANQSMKARGDLLDIIELSGNIKRSADKLGKKSK